MCSDLIRRESTHVTCIVNKMAAAQCLSQYSPTPHPILPGKTPRNFKPRTAPAVLQYKPTQAQCAVSDKRNLSVARTCFDHAGPSSGRKSKL